MSKLLRLSVAGSLAFVLTGCGSSISGEYGGDDCLFDKLAFDGDNTVFVTMFGTEQAATYRIDGERLILSGAGGQGGLVFTRNGNNLEATLMGERMVCTKL